MKIIFGSSRHHYLVKVCVFLITAALVAGMMGCVPLPKEIHNWYDLDAVRNNLGGNHILINDLDSTIAGYEELASPTANQGKGWQPIGNIDNKFTGSFAGQGHEIRDLYINRPDEFHVGLFGSIADEGVIQDIGVVNATVTGETFVGGLVGFTRGTVSNSCSTSNVTGEGVVGGLVGFTRGTVSNSCSTSNVMGQGAIGGLVGWNIEGTISNSYSSSNVTGDSGVGGLVGSNEGGSISYSYSTGSATGSSGVGGLVGRNSEGTVSNSYSTGSVSGTYAVGGVVGENSGYVSNTHYNYDEVLINGENIITIGALFDDDFEKWLANGKFLNINDRLSQESGYYLINDVTDFKQLLAFGQDDNLKFRLTNDMNLDTEPGFYIPYLAGEFDGNGHKISNLSFNFDFVSNVGLFGYLAPGGKVTGLAAEKVNITGYNHVGGLVGWNIEGTVSNSYCTGSVIGEGMVGGLVGENNGTVSDSYSTSNVTGGGFVGGLVGINYKGTVSDSYSSSSVTGWVIVGGLVGINDGTVSNSYSNGSVTGDGDVGGLVGINGEGTISHSYSTSSVTSGGPFVGGLVGRNDGYSSTVSNSYSTGSVTGNSSVGGLVGIIYEGNVSNSYSTGNVTGDTYAGGLIGENEGEGTISNSYWDTETSGQATSDGGTGKNTTEMQNIATFSGAMWDIIVVVNLSTRNPSYIWNIVDDVTYPFLSWQAI